MASADYDAILALGSNVGDKAANIARAIGLLTESGEIEVVRRSGIYRTPPWGKLDQDWFANACLSVATRLSPGDLLEKCQSIEQRMGRVRGEKWGPRVIDIDILVYRDVASSDPALTLPHPRITERAFVLVPLGDIAPELEIAGRCVADWLSAADRSGISPMKEPQL
jgi:2-amino-4-hydroxy-6-hydroxymethyldihydropteridine diphosphokinase